MKKFLKFLAGFLLLLFVAATLYFFLFQRGISYFASKSEACLNCHIMRASFDAWTQSTHYAITTCNDCHLSQGTVMGVIEKIRNGFNHSRALVLKTYTEPLTIHAAGKKIVGSNCVRCHTEMIRTDENHQGMNAATNCLTCHAQAGHEIDN